MFCRAETPIVEKVRQYLNEGTALPAEYLQETVAPLWTSDQSRVRGFILDGFPLISEDVDFMVDRALVPDAVIELQASTSFT